MASVTRNGVCYDLSRSPYVAEVGDYALHFSSVPHLRRFERDLEKVRLWLTDSLSRRFHMSVDASLLAMLNLYRQVETRGFYVVNVWSADVYRRPEDVSLLVTEKE